MKIDELDFLLGWKAYWGLDPNLGWTGILGVAAGKSTAYALGLMCAMKMPDRSHQGSNNAYAMCGALQLWLDQGREPDVFDVPSAMCVVLHYRGARRRLPVSGLDGDRAQEGTVRRADAGEVLP